MLQVLLSKTPDSPPDVMMRPIEQFAPRLLENVYNGNGLTRRLSTEELDQLQKVSTKHINILVGKHDKKDYSRNTLLKTANQ